MNEQMRKLKEEIEKTLKFEIEMNANVAEPNGNTQGWVETLEYVLGQIDAVSNTDKYEGHTPSEWIVEEGANGDTLVSSFHPNEDGLQTDVALIYTNQIDARLIADAPLLLEEYVRVTQALRYVGVSMYLDKNNYRHYDYGHMLDYIMEITGEPDDLSGQMGAMIQDVIEE